MKYITQSIHALFGIDRLTYMVENFLLSVAYNKVVLKMLAHPVNIRRALESKALATEI